MSSFRELMGGGLTNLSTIFFILFFWFQSQQQQRQVSALCSFILYDWIHEITLPPVRLSTWRHPFFLCSWSCEVSLLCYLLNTRCHTSCCFAFLFCWLACIPVVGSRKLKIVKFLTSCENWSVFFSTFPPIFILVFWFQSQHRSRQVSGQ